jgi:hypothetical protein
LSTVGSGRGTTTYSRSAGSSALRIVGLGARCSGCEGSAGSRLLARVDVAAYAAVKRQRCVSFMLGVGLVFGGVGRKSVADETRWLGRKLM